MNEPMRPLNSINSLAISIRIAILALEMIGPAAPSPSNTSRRGRLAGAISGLTLAGIARDSAISILHQDRDDRNRDQQRDDAKYDYQYLAVLFARIVASYEIGRHSYSHLDPVEHHYEQDQRKIKQRGEHHAARRGRGLGSAHQPARRREHSASERDGRYQVHDARVSHDGRQRADQNKDDARHN